MSSDYQPEDKLHPASRRELRVTKVVLLIIVLGLCVVGKRYALWPIVTWPMYSTLMPQLPAAACATELRVVSSRAEMYKLAPSDLIPMDRAGDADKSLEVAFNDSDHFSRDAYRVYLATLVRRALPDVEVETIQGWKVCWEVDPLAVPPLNRDRPVTETLLDSFTASPRASDPKGGR